MYRIIFLIFSGLALFSFLVIFSIFGQHMYCHSRYTVQITANVKTPSEPSRYFYHPDHLGSTSYVTDATGEVYQHLEYFAFGETFEEEHSNTDKTPYLYNGKELDEETGLYCYGARYYDARKSVWVSVDTKAVKYPVWSDDNYTFNNPLTYN